MEREEQADKGVVDAQLGLTAGALGASAAVALFGTGTVGAIVGGAAGPALVLGAKLYARRLVRQQQQIKEVVDVAATCLGGLDILEERASRYDERLELLTRVLRAAGRSTLKAKVHALGRILADGVTDGQSIDEAFALAAALDDLEAVHVLVLKYLDENPSPPEELSRRERAESPGWEARQLVEALPDAASMVEPVVSVLTRHGLLNAGGGVNYPGHVGPAVYRVAPLGARCLFLLHDDEVQHWTG
jgi:hypothetical protein